MRKRSRSNRLILMFLASSLLCLVRADEGRIPTFLIFKPGTDLASTLSALSTQGVRLHHAVPPRIAEAEIPTGINPQSLVGVEKAYTRSIPLSEIRYLGPISVAAAMQWNKLQPKRNNSNNPLQISSVGEYSFDPPVLSKVLGTPSSLTAEWLPIDGAFFYEIQISPTQDFSAILARSITDRTSIRLGIDSSKTSLVYARVRAGERGAADGRIPDKLGAWSEAQSTTLNFSKNSVSGARPIVTSPVDGYQSSGFSIVLEWSGSAPYRIQLARDPDFNFIVADQLSDKNEFTPASSSLHIGDKLYWRVKGWDTSNSDWSETRHIDVTEPRGASDDGFVNPEASR